MKKISILCLFFIVFSSCNQDIKTINFKIKNNSDFAIDSLRIKLNDSSVKLNYKLNPKAIIKIEMEYIQPERFKGENVFIVYYFQNGKGFYANFGYHLSSAFLKKKYDLYIFNEGVSEINRKSIHLKENKHKIR